MHASVREHLLQGASDGGTRRIRGKQEAQRDYRATYDKYRKISEAVLDSEPIPLGHRQTIRRYFEAIRPTDAETDAVQGATKSQ